RITTAPHPTHLHHDHPLLSIFFLSFFQPHAAHRDLHSFPTRRSSDLPLLNTTQQPALAEMRDRATREKLFIAGWTRAEKNDGNDTRAIIQRLVEIRAQQAKLLGFPHYAAWKTKQIRLLCANLYQKIGRAHV